MPLDFPASALAYQTTIVDLASDGEATPIASNLYTRKKEKADVIHSYTRHGEGAEEEGMIEVVFMSLVIDGTRPLILQHILLYHPYHLDNSSSRLCTVPHPRPYHCSPDDHPYIPFTHDHPWYG